MDHRPSGRDDLWNAAALAIVTDSDQQIKIDPLVIHQIHPEMRERMISARTALTRLLTAAPIGHTVAAGYFLVAACAADDGTPAAAAHTDMTVNDF